MQLAFDVGGTFTDFVLQDDSGRLHTAKKLTTYPDPTPACLAGLDELIQRAGVSWHEIARAVHGTTWCSNLVIERKAKGVALATTRGFRDVLAIGRQKRYQIYDLQIDKPEPLIDRTWVWEIDERSRADGTVHDTLDEEQAACAIAEMRERGVRSLAVSFLHSYVNPGHERRFGELVQELAPEIHVSLSSLVSAQFREYERTSTTVVNAYLTGAVREYLLGLGGQLDERGYRGSFYIMQSGGGVAGAETMAQFPVRMIESGPAAGALVAARYGELCAQPDLIAFDMGGTTAKLSLVTGGKPETVDTFELHKIRLAPGSGIPMNVRSLDLVEIGAGGGSIARPELGMIQVGPDSAGSTPGPACYGRGGEAPTVTDANLVLGYLNPKRMAGGSVALDGAAADKAISERLARPLGISLEEAAWGIHAMVNLNMELATRVVSIERGHDPRGLALVATGGSGPVHACRLVQQLGVGDVIMPASSGVASAIGLLQAQLRFDVSRSRLARLGEVAEDGAEALFAEMEAEARAALGSEPDHFEREVDLRYAGQGYELTVAYAHAEKLFEELYARRYGMANPGQPIEITTWRLTAVGARQPVELPRFGTGPPAQPARRQAWFPEAKGFTDTPVYEREKLVHGQRLEGPAIVEERESTTVLPPGVTAEVDQYGSLLARW
ncbi:MAG: hydantoinase/oxoprolinase family protein [Candidatus Dormibacteraeota bacterium]|uniref:Hydantoinase/oxoprolinase family protein n=1 Tax=Candidatus Dormiibacter inghamiae TaxID=3127013 RepID=A0A934KDZ8_9BACT|nr:hydantoinase/oxoprolinase family protein [Candidatus Dormibacteraeota bacterium]MBJ7606816.1 hydantoinase/oxoprolinase family protein [Candidatus Dormibacteraeota bacterium]